MSHPALLLGLAAVLGGCVAPNEQLSFPTAPVRQSATERAYDVDRDGRIDFSLRSDGQGRLRTLAYDDDQDGHDDRLYHLDDFDPDAVPHVIVLFDSIPFAPVAQRWERDAWTWFDPPQKVIPPFPTMSPVIFTRLLGAPPLPGCINQYYDRARNRRVGRLFERTTGDTNSWERRLHYRLRYWENGLAFLSPRRWFRADLRRAKDAVDTSPDRVTIVYLASTSGIVSKYGEAGVEECLDGLAQLTLQLLYERQGAIKVSVLADHGHNFSVGTRLDVPDMLREAGFHPADRLGGDVRDVVVEQDGLVNYCGIHTRRRADVAGALAGREEIELVMFLEGDRVIVRDAAGSACIERVGARYRYRPIEHDVLGYQPVIASMRAAGLLDAAGAATAQDWLEATIDHRWPDAPMRLWEAFHGLVVNPPDIMITTRRGFYVGLSSMEWFVDMASTHGGLDQDDSATFVLTMTGRAVRPMRSGEVIRTIEPAYEPSVLRR